jgi:hypothetical protein
VLVGHAQQAEYLADAFAARLAGTAAAVSMLDLFTHPPAGLRSAPIESRPSVTGELTLTDAELDKSYRATARDLAIR